MKLEARIAALATMKPTQIKAEWHKMHGAEPPRISTNLLARALAHDLQCAAHAGLAERVRKRLADKGPARAVPAPQLAPGTRLVRD